MRCGVGDYTEGLARSLAGRDDVEVAVLTSRSAVATDENLQLFAVAERWDLRELPRILRVVRNWQPDIVHIQYPTQGYGRGLVPQLLPLACRLAGFNVTQTWHEYRRHVTVRALLWLLMEVPLPGGVVFVRPRFEETMPSLLRRALRRKTRVFIPNASSVPLVRLTPGAVEATRRKYARPSAGVVVFFGFIHPEKGVEQLFEIAQPDKHQLVIIGELRPDDAYHTKIAALAASEPWAGRVTMTNFLPAEEVGRVLAAADAVVLPFVAGGGEWNTSIHGARIQGTFVLTTSIDAHGFDVESNTYFARPGDVADMRSALAQYIGRRGTSGALLAESRWESISDAHIALYSKLVAA